MNNAVFELFFIRICDDRNGRDRNDRLLLAKVPTYVGVPNITTPPFLNEQYRKYNIKMQFVSSSSVLVLMATTYNWVSKEMSPTHTCFGKNKESFFLYVA